jgi:hypothetical protein
METLAFTLRKFAMIALFGFLGAVYTVPGEAAITSYQLQGLIGSDNVLDGGTNDIASEAEFVVNNPVLATTSFSLNFVLDDSIVGAPAGVAGSIFASAVSSLELIIGGTTYWSSSAADVSEFINGIAPNPVNHQWSIFETNGAQAGVEFIDLQDSLAGFDLVENMQLGSLNVFLIDSGGALFGSNPPELVAFDGSEFEDSTFELRWLGEFNDYDYRVIGNIDNIIVTTVPVPTAILFFASSLLGLSGMARWKRSSASMS